MAASMGIQISEFQGLLLMSLISGTRKSRVIAKQRDGHEIPLEPTLMVHMQQIVLIVPGKVFETITQHCSKIVYRDRVIDYTVVIDG